MRSLDTRLGASFNIVLGFVTVGLFVMVFYVDPNTMETTSLVPTVSLREVYRESNKSFGSLNVTIRTYAPSKSSDTQTARCDDSILREFTAGLHCTSLATEEKEAKEELIICRYFAQGRCPHGKDCDYVHPGTQGWPAVSPEVLARAAGPSADPGDMVARATGSSPMLSDASGRFPACAPRRVSAVMSADRLAEERLRGDRCAGKRERAAAGGE